MASAQGAQPTATQGNQPKYDPRSLSRALFESAKWWWTVGLLCKFSIFVVTVLAILFSFIPEFALFLIVMFLEVVSELCLIQAERTKVVADTLLTKLDGQESFGWPISRVELNDFILRVPTKVKRSLRQGVSKEQYFENTGDVGAKKALKNLAQSSWWSKQLAGSTAVVCGAGASILTALSVVLLIMSINIIENRDMLTNLGQVTASLLSVVFSIGLVRLAVQYSSFKTDSDRTLQSALVLLSSSRPSDVEVAKLFHEYQISRATSPLLPSWMYKLRKHELNELWDNDFSQQLAR